MPSNVRRSPRATYGIVPPFRVAVLACRRLTVLDDRVTTRLRVSVPMTEWSSSRVGSIRGLSHAPSHPAWGPSGPQATDRRNGSTMITHFTAALAEDYRDRRLAEARAAHAARLARQAGRSDVRAKPRLSAYWLLSRIPRRSVTDRVTAEPRPILEPIPQHLPRRSGDMSNRVAHVSAGRSVTRAEAVPTGERG